MVHVSGWIHGIGALTVQLQYVKGEVAALAALFPPLDGFREYRETVCAITASANAVLFRVVEDLLAEYRDGRLRRWTARTG
jgi:anaerobic magnesium-protoporphyrin IX monomethyl ester cyclase